MGTSGPQSLAAEEPHRGHRTTDRARRAGRKFARTQVERCRELTALIRELDPLVTRLAPTLVALCGCATLTAAKIIGATAGVERFEAESIRVLKRRLSDVVHRALLADIDPANTRTKATVTAA
jgi:hypothetical protein